MAKEKEDKIITPQEQLKQLLKETKDDHYNYEVTHDYITPCSSLKLTAALDGGLPPGAHRMVGLASGGKTSCALDFMYHFLKTKGKYPRRGLFIKAEGRLSSQVQERSGIKFVYNEDEWEEGTCFVLESQIYEVVFKFKRSLISENPTQTEYFFITDSADGLIKRDDAKKPEEESITVGGGSLITSVFLKKVGLAMAKRGHTDVYISQIRDQIKVNQYEKTTGKQGKASGPRALEHQAGVVLEFCERFSGDLIQEGDKKSKILGHYAKVKIIKSDNEKNMVEIQYPIRYGQTNANSVWLSFELVDRMMVWGQLQKKGAWLPLLPEFREQMMTDLNRSDIPEQLHGIDKARQWIEDNPDIQAYLFKIFTELEA